MIEKLKQLEMFQRSKEKDQKRKKLQFLGQSTVPKIVSKNSQKSLYKNKLKKDGGGVKTFYYHVKSEI